MKLEGVILFNMALSFKKCAIEPVREIKSDFIQSNLQKLIQKYGRNKAVPSEIQSNFYTAIGYYPELKSVNIKVRYGKIKTTMQCRPRWDFLFNSRKRRSYVIYIAKPSSNNVRVEYQNLPLNAQIGVIGHELAHVVDYLGMNNLQMIKFGIDYLISQKRKTIENKIDLIAIGHGLGHQIKDFSKFIFEESNVSGKYLKYKNKYYYKPNQIREILSLIPIYVNQ